jgi:hypothetical protein
MPAYRTVASARKGLKEQVGLIEWREAQMRNRLVIVLAVAVVLLSSASLFAHHGGQSILSGKTATLKGTVKAWLWSNPHCLLTFDVKGEDGKVVEWVA